MQLLRSDRRAQRTLATFVADHCQRDPQKNRVVLLNPAAFDRDFAEFYRILASHPNRGVAVR